MEFTPDLKEVYNNLTDLEKKQFRAAMASDDLEQIERYKKNYAPGVKRGRGRPDMGITLQSRRDLNAKKKMARSTPHADDFNRDIIEHVTGEVISPEDTAAFKECYQLSCDSCLDSFVNNYPDRVKKPAHTWIFSLLIDIRKCTPKIDYRDAEKVGAAWEVFTGLMFNVGLFPTFEAFTILTNIYMQSLEKVQTPQHIELIKKIREDCKNNMVVQVATNPYTQVNKMFLLKSVYGFQESPQQKTIEVNHNIRRVDDIPIFNSAGALPDDLENK